MWLFLFSNNFVNYNFVAIGGLGFAIKMTVKVCLVF